MIVEYILVASLVWSKHGLMQSHPINGRYETQQACLQVVSDLVAIWSGNYNVPVIPIGVICERRERGSKEN